MNRNITLIKQTVFVVDDDAAVRDSLKELFESVNICSEQYASAQEFLDEYDTDMEGCLVLDIRMPGKSGLDLQQELVDKNSRLPIIFITGHGDVPMAVDAMKRGAVEFIQKPFRDQALLDCINDTLEKARQKSLRKNSNSEFLERLKCLTTREREVLDFIVEGKANKVIAIDLSISQRTVENHRAKIIEKLGAKSTANLIRLMVESKF